MKRLYNIIRRLFDFMVQKVCFTFAVSFFSVLGAVAAVPGMVLIWATIPYENPSYFHSEIIFSIVLLFIFALIHWLLYGLGRLWGKRWEESDLRTLNDHVKGLQVWSDISTSTLTEISDLLARLPGMNFRMSMFLSIPVVIIMTVNNYVNLGNPLYALYVFRGGCVALITYIMFTYLITELITLNLRRETRLIIADRDAWKGTLSDDLVASRLMRESRLEVRFEPGCVVASPLDMSLGQAMSFIRRQYLVARLYTFDWWLFSLLAMTFRNAVWLGNLGVLLCSLVTGSPSPWIPVEI